MLKADDHAKEENITLETTLWKPSEEDPLVFYRTLQNSKKRKRKVILLTPGESSQLFRSHQPSAYRPIMIARHQARFLTTKKRFSTFSVRITRFRWPSNESSIARAKETPDIRNGPVHTKESLSSELILNLAEEKAAFEVGVATKGKNFFKIREEYLPKKDVKDLVLHYYFVSHLSLNLL